MVEDEDPNGVPYIRAIEAVDYISGHVGSKYQARSLIADAIHSGDLTASADKLWSIADIDPTDEWSEIVKGAELIASNVEIPVDYWMLSNHWPDETRYWRWKEGNFLINSSEFDIDPFCGDAYENVMFDYREIMALVGKTERSGAGGRKPDKVRWSQFWVNFLYDCSGDIFDWSQFENKHQLKQAMLGSSPGLFSDSAVDDAVNVAWEGLVQRSARERLARRPARVSEE